MDLSEEKNSCPISLISEAAMMVDQFFDYVFRKTRTCIFTPGYPGMVPEDLSRSGLSSALDGASLVYFDGRLHETALVVAEEVVIILFWLHLQLLCCLLILHRLTNNSKQEAKYSPTIKKYIDVKDSKTLECTS